MTILDKKRGAWINQFALPDDDNFVGRGLEVDYVVIKFGHAHFEVLAQENGIPWLAERMGESGAGLQNGPENAEVYAAQLAEQANHPGCIGAVINLEEADGGWHTDDGWATARLVNAFRAAAPPNMPLFASLDTRGNRPNYPYQQMAAALCDGVMPMCYPDAFGLSATASFDSVLTQLLLSKWAGKDIIITLQSYGDANTLDQAIQAAKSFREGRIQGLNWYTLGHASGDQWRDALSFKPYNYVQPLPDANVERALIAIRAAWTKQWTAIAERGTVEEADALLAYWKKLVGQL